MHQARNIKEIDFEVSFKEYYTPLCRYAYSFILDQDEAKWMAPRNVSLFNDLTSGAVRQLDTEFLELYEWTTAEIKNLRDEVAALKLLVNKLVG